MPAWTYSKFMTHMILSDKALKLWVIVRILFFGLPERMDIHHHAKRD